VLRLHLLSSSLAVLEARGPAAWAVGATAPLEAPEKVPPVLVLAPPVLVHLSDPRPQA
jgi:hypothetical protein